MVEFMCKGMSFEDAFAQPPLSSTPGKPYLVEWTKKELDDALANYDRMVSLVRIHLSLALSPL